jgi:hypothetical protein
MFLCKRKKKEINYYFALNEGRVKKAYFSKYEIKIPNQIFIEF